MQNIQHNYVISLTTATDRREHITKEFGKQNITFEFFDAITPNNLELKAKELGIDISNSPLTKGEIACALSHIALYYLAKEKELDYICIFEDDIYLGENANLLLNNNNYIDDNVDIVKIEKNFDTVILSVFSIKEYLGRKFYKLTKSNSGTGGYIVTKKGIDFLVKNIKEIKDVEIDNLLFKQLLLKKEYTVWQMQPAVCIQDCLLNPQTSSFGVMGGEGGERDQRRDKKNKKKLPLIIRLVKEVKRPFAKLNKKIFGKKAYFK